MTRIRMSMAAVLCLPLKGISTAALFGTAAIGLFYVVKKQKAKKNGVLEKDKEDMRKKTEKDRAGRYMEEGNICVGVVELW